MIPYLQPYKGKATRHTCPKCGMPHSFTLYLISGVFVVELLTVPAYLAISRNVYATQAAIYFPVMGYCLLLSIVALQTFEQEEKAIEQQAENILLTKK